MVKWLRCLRNLLFSDIPLLHYINLSSWVIYYLFSGGLYLSFGILMSNPLIFVSHVTVSEVFCGEVLQTFELSAILLPIISPIAYHQLHITNCICCFLNYSFLNSFQCICSRFFSMIRKFLALFTTSVFTYTFTYFYPYFQQNTKIHNLSQIYDLWVQLNVLFFKCYTAVNNWSYIGGFEPCSANHTSM